MTIPETVEQLIYQSKKSRFVLAVIAITLLKTGIWYMPNLLEQQRAIAINPFVNPLSDPVWHYLMFNWLGPFLAWMTGLTGELGFFGFYLAFSFAFSFLFIRTVFRIFPDEMARSSVIIFSVLPVSAISFFWVGMDSMTLFLMLLALAYPSAPIVTLAAGVLTGMQHFEQGVFAAVALLFAVHVSQKQDYPLLYSAKFCILYLAGILAGKIVLTGIFDYYSIHVVTDRMDVLKLVHADILKQFFYHPHHIIWSVLGAGWLVALKFADSGRKSIPFFIALAGLCLLLLMAADQTRVLAIVTFPLVAAYWLFNRNFLGKISRREISLLFVIWVMTPWMYVWQGLPRWSVLPHDVAWFLHKTSGWFSIPADPAYWPFTQ
jgi:hypothetical protein